MAVICATPAPAESVPLSHLMSDHLVEFLTWWWSEATSDAPAEHVTCHGLCDNADMYHRHMMGRDGYLSDELAAWFDLSGLDRFYPFGGRAAYNRHYNNDTMHLCPERLAWVRNALGLEAPHA